jgi:CBS domain-containing protein
MHDQRVGSVVVTDVAGRPVGIFTGRDAVNCLAKQLHPEKVLLPDVMTRDPQTLVPGRTAIEALRLMHDGGFRHISVVENGAVIGVASRGDFRGIEQDRLDEETGIWERL